MEKMLESKYTFLKEGNMGVAWFFICFVLVWGFFCFVFGGLFLGKRKTVYVP